MHLKSTGEHSVTCGLEGSDPRPFIALSAFDHHLALCRCEAPYRCAAASPAFGDEWEPEGGERGLGLSVGEVQPGRPGREGRRRRQVPNQEPNNRPRALLPKQIKGLRQPTRLLSRRKSVGVRRLPVEKLSWTRTS